MRVRFVEEWLDKVMTANTIAKRPLSASSASARAEGPWSDLALHSIGWKAFQDLCSQVCEVILQRPVEIYREAQDGGQDAVFLITSETEDSSSIGTVQVKHSSDPARKLQLSDLTPELEHVELLITLGQADTYVLMTCMSVEAPVALKIRKKLIELGVRKPHILGKQYLVRSIRSSPKLRALVPQVYGLGDLTSILDQRLIQQTLSLLDHWIPKLKVYVPTDAHRKAVKALSDHGIVLLLGNPSTGKSAIGAILSTIASEDLSHTVLNLTSPRDFEAGWNPNDPGRFFWIDDAFGSNVVRDEYVQDWTSIFTKVQTAISHGNRFLLTSRRHIYEAAKTRLGQRNLPVFINGKAVVDVGNLTAAEKSQILYNHINFGNQTQSWKKNVKPYLRAVAEVEDFLPGIAERLGDPAFTKSLGTSEKELIRFMKEPREHLIDTINALESPLRAALVLVYVHQGTLDRNAVDELSAKTVSELMDAPLPRILNSLVELKGSFLRVSSLKEHEVWTFAHPTIADALTDILKERPHQMAALLRGTTIDTILGNFVCEGTIAIKDALIIPSTLDEILTTRIVKTPNEPSINGSLFNFLAEHASEQVFRSVIASDPAILERSSWRASRITYDPKILVHARAHRLGLLEKHLQDESAERLEEAALNDFMISFFRHEDILNLIPPSRLLALGAQLRSDALVSAPERILEIIDDVDLDEDAESNFEHYADGLDVLQEILEFDNEAGALIAQARRAISEATRIITEKQQERDETDNSDWNYMSTVSRQTPTTPTTGDKAANRSVFEDVDR